MLINFAPSPPLRPNLIIFNFKYSSFVNLYSKYLLNFVYSKMKSFKLPPNPLSCTASYSSQNPFDPPYWHKNVCFKTIGKLDARIYLQPCNNYKYRPEQEKDSTSYTPPYTYQPHLSPIININFFFETEKL